jgi:hypothetical protein
MTKKNPKIKRQKTYELCLTKFELLHLRDLMGVLLPPDGAETLSRSLAALEGRSLIETKLWEKVVSLCSDADLPLDAEAPDYIIAPTSSPSLGVFQIAQEDEEGEQVEGQGFLPKDDEDEDEDSEEDEDE